MSDTVAPVMPIRPGLASWCGDTQAMNDIHAVLTAASRLAPDEAAACIAEIVARTGRRLDPARAITAEVTSDRHGMPIAWIDADGTVVLAGQDPDGAGVLIQVTTRDAAEAAALVITIDGRSSVSAVRPGHPGQAPLRPVPGRDEALPSELDGEGSLS